MIRGVESKHEVAARQLARDTRPLGTRAAEFLAKPEVIMVICGTSIATTVFYPIITDLAAVLCTALFLFSFEFFSNVFIS